MPAKAGQPEQQDQPDPGELPRLPAEGGQHHHPVQPEEHRGQRFQTAQQGRSRDRAGRAPSQPWAQAVPVKIGNWVHHHAAPLPRPCSSPRRCRDNPDKAGRFPRTRPAQGDDVGQAGRG